MNAYKANLINALALMVLSTWEYVSSLTPHISDLHPVLIGVVLLVLNNGIQYEIKGQKIAALVVTAILFIILINPLKDAMGNTNNESVFRIGIMMLTSFMSLVFLIKGLFSARGQYLKK
ncbi:MAG: hypothetical protein H7X99_02765 [Saprospiraceae bacterium]|nr:hypothetical protein [Saprospiraceae bacterium]